MNGTESRRLRRLYDVLARWQAWQRRLRRALPGAGFDLRKRLTAAPGGPVDGGTGLDLWLQERVGHHRWRGAQLLDLGCGFGASLRRWLAAGVASAVGVTQSRVQARVAARETARCGAADRATFVVQDFGAPLPGRFGVVLAIESLAHATDLAAVLRRVTELLAPGGVLVWVDDQLAEPDRGDADVASLAARWSSPPLRDIATVRRLLHEAGLRVVAEGDLTAQVRTAEPSALARRERSLLRWRRLLPSRRARALLDAFAGGVALERLYARGLARYRFWLAERPPADPVLPLPAVQRRSVVS
jgi:SAM-dependent methyltransferase